ncbi:MULTISPECIES: DoxX family protein [unclassified Zobellia]|uniref:DoxX family protein n=1 Tax=unclassified Zobellia TaxID=2620635 RepID=UPI001C077D1C|nr:MULTISPECIES: DoxX family protein [unclassified Zobellia]MBU2975961.1 DoxX family protein [Zobellia sp. B3R18]MDO6819778.1 DoxX family protein [Zobellia sp. 1_MG-2023]
MKKDKTIYWVSTILLCLLFIMGAMMYLFNYPRAESFFISLGFPTWIIYPLAALKIIAPIVILVRKSLFLKELAYAGFIFDALLALVAHLMVRDGEYMFAILALIFTVVSWVYDRKVFGRLKQQFTVH